MTRPIHQIEIISTASKNLNKSIWGWGDLKEVHLKKVNDRLEELVQEGWDIIDLKFCTNYCKLPSEAVPWYGTYHTQIHKMKCDET